MLNEKDLYKIVTSKEEDFYKPVPLYRLNLNVNPIKPLKDRLVCNKLLNKNSYIISINNNEVELSKDDYKIFYTLLSFKPINLLESYIHSYFLYRFIQLIGNIPFEELDLSAVSPRFKETYLEFRGLLANIPAYRKLSNWSS